MGATTAAGAARGHAEQPGDSYGDDAAEPLRSSVHVCLPRSTAAAVEFQLPRKPLPRNGNGAARSGFSKRRRWLGWPYIEPLVAGIVIAAMPPRNKRASRGQFSIADQLNLAERVRGDPPRRYVSPQVTREGRSPEAPTDGKTENSPDPSHSASIFRCYRCDTGPQCIVRKPLFCPAGTAKPANVCVVTIICGAQDKDMTLLSTRYDSAMHA